MDRNPQNQLADSVTWCLVAGVATNVFMYRIWSVVERSWNSGLILGIWVYSVPCKVLFMINWCRFSWGSKTFYLKIKPSVGKTALNPVVKMLEKWFFFNWVVFHGALAMALIPPRCEFFLSVVVSPSCGFNKNNSRKSFRMKETFSYCSEIQSHCGVIQITVGIQDLSSILYQPTCLLYALSTCI